MIHMTIDNESCTAIFYQLHCNVLRGLVDRIAASHPGGLGSIPCGGIFVFSQFFQFLPNFEAFFGPWANLGEQKAISP